MNLACRFNKNGSFRRGKFPQISSFEIRQRAKTFLGLKSMGVHQLSDREPFVQPHSRRNHGRNVTIVFAFHSPSSRLEITSNLGLPNNPEKRNPHVQFFLP